MHHIIVHITYVYNIHMCDVYVICCMYVDILHRMSIVYIERIKSFLLILALKSYLVN